MFCPVCVVGGIGFILSRIFGLLMLLWFCDRNDGDFDGVLGKSYLGKKMEKKKRSADSTQH